MVIGEKCYILLETYIIKLFLQLFLKHKKRFGAVVYVTMTIKNFTFNYWPCPLKTKMCNSTTMP